MIRSPLFIQAAKAQPPAQATLAAAYVIRRGAHSPLARPFYFYLAVRAWAAWFAAISGEMP